MTSFGPQPNGEWSLLASLPLATRDDLVSAGHLAGFARGETIIASRAVSPPVHLIITGRVGIEMAAASGTTGLLDLFGQFAALGETTLDGTMHVGRAVALERTTTIVVPRDRFEQVQRAQPALQREIARRIAHRADHLVSLVLGAWFATAESRVLTALGRLAGGNGNEHTSVTVNLTQDELAMLSGCSRPTVNRTLAEAERLGLVHVTRGSVTVVDLDGLVRRAASA
jgi:CRP/FNR family transcriptional regulator, cyclic AMP receptor protein